MISAAKLSAKKDERRALMARAKAGDGEAARILEREHGTKVIIGAAAQALAPPIRVMVTRREKAMPNPVRWGASTDVPDDLSARLKAAIGRSGKAMSEVAREIEHPTDGGRLPAGVLMDLAAGRRKRTGALLLDAIEAWIANAPESAPPGDGPEAPPATRARAPKPPGRPRRPTLPGPEERQPTREERSLPATVPATAPATGLQEALAAVSALLGPSQGPDDGRRRVKIVSIEVVL